MQQGKWQRRHKNHEDIPKPDLAIVADATGQTYRVSLQELITGRQPALMLYGKDGRLICGKPKLGRDNKRRETIALTDICRIVSPQGVNLPTVDLSVPNE